MSDIEEKQRMILNIRKDRNFKTETGGPPVWLISFTDVIALMLTFFVLLYSMTSPEEEKWVHKIGITSQDRAEYNSALGAAGTKEGVNISRDDYNLAQDLQYLEALLNETLNDQKIKDRIRIKGAGDYLNVYLSSDLELNQRDFAILLAQLDPILSSLDNQIIVVGQENVEDVFFDLQSFARILKDNGYRWPVSLSVQHYNSGDFASSMMLSIRSDDGRRIVP